MVSKSRVLIVKIHLEGVLGIKDCFLEFKWLFNMDDSRGLFSVVLNNIAFDVFSKTLDFSVDLC